MLGNVERHDLSTKAGAGTGSTASARLAGYKPHIDGLRAVSIIAVLAFHAGIPGVGGGFVGVDIFFVISGYLIINQIIAALDAGSFSVWDFYARRVLRIVPPYLLVLAVTVVVGVVVLRDPRDLNNFAGSVGIAPFFLTNFYFLRRSGYFDVGAHDLPLLHTWSLAVEEQFYLVTPLALLALFWLVRRRGWNAATAIALAGLAIGLPSLVGAILLTPADLNPLSPDRNPAFFLPQWRAWQFVAGGAIALLVDAIRVRPRLIGTMAGLLGAALLAVSIGLGGLEWLGARIDPSGRVANYPGLAAILPTLGAVLVIGSGLLAPSALLTRALSLGPVVFVGRLSYALYLWHWPLLVYARMLPFDVTPGTKSAIALALAVLLSLATHFALERPAATWRLRPRMRTDRRLALAVIGIGLAASALVAIAAQRLADDAYAASLVNPLLVKAKSANVEASGPCLSAHGTVLPGCLDGRAPAGILIGDSHAHQFESRLAFEAERHGVRLISLATPGCSPLGVAEDPVRERRIRLCIPMIDKLERLGPRLRADTDFAIVAGLWQALLSSMSPESAAPAEAMLRRQFSALMNLFSDKQRVLVVGPVPQLERRNPFTCLDLSRVLGLSTDRCGISRAFIDEDRARTVAIMKEVIAEHPNARYVDPIDVLCNETLCSPVHDGAMVYADFSHLNGYGAMLVYDRFRDDFDWAFGTAPAGK